MMVLDVCCGAEKIYDGWHEKLGENFVGIDIRKGNFTLNYDCNMTAIKNIVTPHILASMGYLQFKDQSFDSIVCDTPHMDLGTLTGFWAKLYGSWTKEEMLKTLQLLNQESARVLKPGGHFILKIMPALLSTYEQSLSNFCFYLPISTIRKHGAIKTKKTKTGALWAIGISNSPVSH
jgi:SAM-dependent methyltransferase